MQSKKLLCSLQHKYTKEFGAEAINTLANSIYVLIDLRDRSNMTLRPEVTLDQFVLISLVRTMISLFPEDRLFLEISTSV
jgi:hypothetical protein